MNRNLLRLLAPLLLSALAIASCVRDRCKDVVCLNGGLCVDGRCTCPSGYEGERCGERWNEKFAGTWQNEARRLDADNNVTTARYRIFIHAADSAGIFMIDSLEGITDHIVCEIAGANTFRFRTQYSRDSVLYIESGQGTLDTVTGAVTAGYVYRLYGSPGSSEMSWSKEP